MKDLFRKKSHPKIVVSTLAFLPFSSAGKDNRREESGFSLVEVMIALIVFLIAMLGVFVTFVYAVNYNSGNNSRAQALAVLQREVETMRSAKFTPKSRDSILDGGVKAAKPATSADLSKFIVQITVDDDPFTEGFQVDNSTTFKEITVTVNLDRPTPGWQTSVPSTVVLRRTRAN